MNRLTIWILALLGLSLAVYFTNLGGAPLRINAEERCAEVVETMVATNDYALPRLDGEIRLNKPPLFYWTATLAAEPTGGFSLTALRFPSAVSAILLLGLMLYVGARLGAPVEALVAAGLLAVSYLFVQQARRGSYEMLLALFSNATLFSAMFLIRRPSWALGLLTAGLFALALMTKGTPVFAVTLAPVLVWVLMMGRGRQLLNWRVIALFILALVAGFSWYLYLLVAHPEARKQLIAIALLPFGVATEEGAGAKHYEAPWFYLLKIWDENFPVSLLIPVAGLYLWRHRFFPPESPWRLLGLSALVPFAIFSLMPQKQDHYLLPMLPSLAFLCGAGATWALKEGRARYRLFLQIPGWIAAALLLASSFGALAGLLVIADWPVVPAALMSLMIFLAGALVGLAVVQSNWRASLPAALVGFGLVWIGFFAVINPVADNFGSGRIYFDKRYDPEKWRTKFQQYPLLVKLLDVKSGLDDRVELESVYKRPAAPLAYTKGAPSEDKSR